MEIQLCIIFCIIVGIYAPPPEPTQPQVECEECLTDCCEELMIAIETWEDCSCPVLAPGDVETRENYFRRLSYRELAVWLRRYCFEHNAHVHA